MSCAGGLFWHPSGWCDWKHNVDCTARDREHLLQDMKICYLTALNRRCSP